MLDLVHRDSETARTIARSGRPPGCDTVRRETISWGWKMSAPATIKKDSVPTYVDVLHTGTPTDICL